VLYFDFFKSLYTQQRLAEELGMRQQTISEWETGQYRPRGATVMLLDIVANRADFVFDDDTDNEGSGGWRATG